MAPPTSSSGMAGRGRFELPVLAPLDSLTAGTNIPPPPDSPVEEKPPAVVTPPPSASAKPSSLAVTSSGNGVANGSPSSPARILTSRGGTNGQAENMSPTSPSRPGSVRRFFSRNSLNQSYNDGAVTEASPENAAYTSRPSSPSSASTMSRPSAKKRGSSWFSRFSGGGMTEPSSKRTSIVYEEKPTTPIKAVAPNISVPKGPPPPQLPPLHKLKHKVDTDGGMDAEDMFKNIG